MYYAQLHGTSNDWVGMMKESIFSILPFFNTIRMVKEYYQKFYYPIISNKIV